MTSSMAGKLSDLAPAQHDEEAGQALPRLGLHSNTSSSTALPSHPSSSLESQTKVAEPSSLQEVRTTLRKGIYLFLSPHETKKGTILRRAALVYQLLAAAVIVGLFVVDSASAPTVTTSAYWWIQLVLTCAWTIEHVLKLWSCVEREAPEGGLMQRWRARFWFALRPLMLLEVVSLASLVVDLAIVSNSYRGLAVLRMFRLLTLYRIERDFQFFGPVVGVLGQKRKELIATLGIATFVLAIASVVMFYIEAPYNDQFCSVLMSMWWGVTALTTVGYGDMVPNTGPGRVVASLVAFMGTGMFGLFAAILADGFREAMSKKKEESSAAAGQKKEFSPEDLEAALRQYEKAAEFRAAALQSEMRALRADLLHAMKGGFPPHVTVV